MMISSGGGIAASKESGQERRQDTQARLLLRLSPHPSRDILISIRKRR